MRSNALDNHVAGWTESLVPYFFAGNSYCNANMFFSEEKKTILLSLYDSIWFYMVLYDSFMYFASKDPNLPL